MSLLSIDVGIKNLAYCLLDTHSVSRWGVVSLIDNDKITCDAHTKNVRCTNDAKFTKHDKNYCLKHAKKEEFLVPNSGLRQASIKKLDIAGLKSLADTYSIECVESIKKKQLQADILDYVHTHCFDTIDNVHACDVDLITIGRSLKRKFDEIFTDECKIEKVIIENQISPIANRMKTLQGMIAQYFIMKDTSIQIEFVSAVNKLKHVEPDMVESTGVHTSEEGTTPEHSLSYNQRKKLGVERCGRLIKDKNYTEWYQFFVNSKKKDDLSDAFLQGIWYLRHSAT